MKVNNMASRRGFLEQMPTDELDKMLQAELQKENIDEDLVRLLLIILEERETDYPLEIDESITNAAKKFEAYDQNTSSARTVKKPNRLLKAASILIVIGTLFFAVPKVAAAENVFELLARWTDSIFEFFSPTKANEQPEYVFKTDHPGLQQIYDAVVKMGITDPVVPMWVPEGYELEKVKVDKWTTESTLYADLRNDENYIIISIITQSNRNPFQHSKDAQDVKIYELMGIEHYVVLNKEEWITTWIIQNIECTIVTDCQEEEVYKLLDSIYTMEAY